MPQGGTNRWSRLVVRLGLGGFLVVHVGKPLVFTFLEFVAEEKFSRKNFNILKINKMYFYKV